MKPRAGLLAIAIAALLSILPVISVSRASEDAGASIVIAAKTVHTAVGAPIEDGVVVIRDGRIVAVGPRGAVTIPDGLRVIEATVAVPGLIDARGTVGLTGIYNQDHDQDQLERSAPIQPQLRAIDAYNAREPLVAYLRSLGVTTVQTGHAPGELVSGQLMIVKTVGETADEAALVRESAVAVTLGATAHKGEGKSPGTRAKAVSMLRQALLKARAYRDARLAGAAGASDARSAKDGTRAADDTKQDSGRDLESETLARVLDRELPLVVTANRAQDIASALRLQEEFGFRLVLDMAAESGAMLDEIRRANVPVILHATMYRMVGETENASFTTAARLAEAGVLFAIQSGYESYVPKTRVVLFEAALAAAHGLGFDRALRAVTIDAARILGIDARVGSLEIGKDGDIALYDGDPFEITTHCTGVVIGGRVVSDIRR